uniref:Ribosomal protein L6 n=1 Tax=Ancoracysta twista TaxID=2044563 RepID=A0A2H4R8G0_9EUKA|nr:ribosomal protein L6 [Ancoracysta twista]ATY40940.1 ribosomal protein L6 [Ancoracysta twista]
MKELVASSLSLEEYSPLNLKIRLHPDRNNNKLTLEGRIQELSMVIPKEIILILKKSRSKKGKPFLKLLGWGYDKKKLNILLGQIERMAKLSCYGHWSQLSVSGIGYRIDFNKQERKLTFKLGYATNQSKSITQGVTARTVSDQTVQIYGLSPERVDTVVSSVKRFRKPDAYKNKGVLVEGSFYLKKDWKKK